MACGDSTTPYWTIVICEDLTLVAWKSASELLAFLTEIFTADLLHRLRIYYEKLGPSPFFLQVQPVVASILSTLDWSGYYKRLFAARYGKELEGGRSSIGSGGRRGRQRVSSLRLARGAWPAPQPKPTRWLQIDTVPRQELTTKRCTTPKSPAQVYYHFLANNQPRIVHLYHRTQLGSMDSIFRVQGIAPPRIANPLSVSPAFDMLNSPAHTLLHISTQHPVALPVPGNPSPPSLLVFELDTALLHSGIPPTPGTEPFRVDYFADTDAEREELRKMHRPNRFLIAIWLSRYNAISKVAIWARDGRTYVLDEVFGFNEAPLFQVAFITLRALECAETYLVDIDAGDDVAGANFTIH
ncbi:hypothetical protein DFH08DRAFT_957445 [Mycena albidolilacea]|uniref:Uncharacterized protein n=1 Tax=Mycena albidolilacea TaxID=1033008 RepID=A0AAD7EUJ0_9AGAR|nr:hypothetical protein DFH08DRAFT_957445 [Mycena albidolilacea]